MRAKLEGIGIRMQELARKKLFQNRWLNPVPETFQGWARHIRQQRDYRNTVRRTLRQYMLRRRALSFRRWVSFAEEVIDARLNLQSSLRKSGRARVAAGRLAATRSRAGGACGPPPSPSA